MVNKKVIFEVEGGKQLSGTIRPQGAKNEALQILCAVLLTEEEVIIKNIPLIRDVKFLIKLLEGIGVEIKKVSDHDFSFKAKNLSLDYLKSEEFLQNAQKIRASILLVGPLLARFGKAIMPKPGGDKIGRRRLDTHFIGLKKLGAKIDYPKGQEYYSIETNGLKGKYILLDEPSVTGTANIIMAASLAQGKTTIYNAACEPYIQQLCRLLRSMGAKISGEGSNLIEIEGVEFLGGATHTMLADMIEVGSFIGLAAMTNSEITIENAGVQSLGQIPEVFRRMGVKLTINGDNIHIPKQDHYRINKFMDGAILTVADGPWPMFTPDLLSIVLVVATQAAGTLLVHQKMFESRLFFVDKLIDMGAQIILCDPHRATVIGLNKNLPLRGISMTSPDIRAGVSLLIAALSAEGKSTIYNAEQIDRGYEAIDTRLNRLGASIKRIEA